MKTKKQGSYYWNNLYSFSVNTRWGKSEPDPKLKDIIYKVLKNINTELIRVLDIGCGNGRNSKIFNDLQVQYTGIDFAQAAIDHCKKTYSDRSFYQRDITRNLEIGQNDFDLIFDYSCFHSLHPKYWQKYVENILSVSNKNTVFILGVWFGEKKLDGNISNKEPDFIPYGYLDEWFVNIEDVKMLFVDQFTVEDYFIDKAPPHDINNGLMYCTLKRNCK